MNELKSIEPLILTLRGQRVILDADLAEIYGVPTKAFNQAVKRNADRFPDDFMFQLTTKEWRNLKSQIVTSSSEVIENEGDESLRSQSVTLNQPVDVEVDRSNRSQFVTGPQKHRDPRSLPRAFTEHGAIMAATVLNSPEAVAMSVFVVRAFVLMRERLAANAEILRRLAEIDKTLLEHNGALAVIWEQLQPLLNPPPDPPRKKIGFDFYQE
ncbi:MAG: ORF6N domain-containing protein [Kiritimatiellales bacterium]